MAKADEALKDLEARVAALEAKLAGQPPASGSSLFIFNRPAKDAPRVGLGSRMSGPDVLEAVRRACHCVNYQGDRVLSPAAEDAAWYEIERLKVLDPNLLPSYELLDPAFAGFALLTGLIQPASSDGASFGVTKFNREAFAGQTIPGWLEAEFQVSGTPSGE